MLAWFERGEILVDDVIAWPLEIAIYVFLATMLVLAATNGSAYNSRTDALTAVRNEVASHVALTQSARSTIYPPLTIADASIGAPAVTNCINGGYCLEKLIHTVDTTGDIYSGTATLVGSKGQHEVVTFISSGLDTSGAAQNVVIKKRILIGAADFVRYASIPVTSIATDPRNPAASVASAYLAQVGASPVIRTITWGPPFDIGNNNLELDDYQIGSIHVTTGMAIAALPAKNLSIVVGFVTPTPLPTAGANGAAQLLYYWPQVAGGPSSFQVHMLRYHDAYFAENSACLQPTPLYIPGSSPSYIPGQPPNPPNGMFGQAGPWVYPNPNPLSPLGQDSGPGTFSVSTVSPGSCNVPIYTVYTPRNGAAAFSYPATVMDWLTLSQNGRTATPITAALSVQGTLQHVGDNAQVAVSKQFDSIASSTFGGGAVQIGASCSSFLQGSLSGTGQSGSTTVSTLTLQIVGSGNQTGASQTCTGTLSDAFGEPPVSFTLAVAASTGPLLGPSEIIFSSPTVGYGPSLQERIAKALNALGGGQADAGGTSCSIAQLWMWNSQGQSVLDANSADGFNSTDSSGCVTNADGHVHLWASEPSYNGNFDANQVAQNCFPGFAAISQGQWSSGSDPAIIKPAAVTSGCTFPVESSDHNISNGTALTTTVVVNATATPAPTPAPTPTPTPGPAWSAITTVSGVCFPGGKGGAGGCGSGCHAITTYNIPTAPTTASNELVVGVADMYSTQSVATPDDATFPILVDDGMWPGDVIQTSNHAQYVTVFNAAITSILAQSPHTSPYADASVLLTAPTASTATVLGYSNIPIKTYTFYGASTAGTYSLFLCGGGGSVSVNKVWDSYVSYYVMQL